MHADEIDVGAGDQLADRVVVARRHDADDLAPVGLREHRRDDALPEAAADHRDLHSPSTSGVSSRTGRWKRRSPAWVTGPIVNASSTVPDTDVPAEQEAATSTLHSSTVRTAHTGCPRLRDRGHQPVARSRPEPRADVEAAADSEHHDRREQHRDAHGEAVLFGDEVDAEVGDEPDRQRVQHRAETEALVQRDPREQHDEPDEHHDETERQVRDVREALVQHVPGRDAEAGAHRDRDREARARTGPRRAAACGAAAPPRSGNDNTCA